MNMNLLLAIDEINPTQPIDSFADKLSYGGTMLLIGILTVFSVLLIIMISLFLFKFLFHDLPKKRAAAEKPQVKEPAAPVIIANDPEEEVVAAIAAAIAMAESESNGIKFRVVSFKRR